MGLKAYQQFEEKRKVLIQPEIEGWIPPSSRK
jgi:hypothetical protein